MSCLMHAYVFFLNFFLIPYITGTEDPISQIYCDLHEQGQDFYHQHKLKMHRYRVWFCLESYESRIKLCADMYAMSTDNEVVSYDTPKVIEKKECERSYMTWFEPVESSLEDLIYSKEEEKPTVRLGLDTFKCPITQMNVSLKARNYTRAEVDWPFDEEEEMEMETKKGRKKKKKKPKKEMKKSTKRPAPWTEDFYISVGRNLLTVAILTNSTKGDNICLDDVLYYPQAEEYIDACFFKEAEW